MDFDYGRMSVVAHVAKLTNSMELSSLEAPVAQLFLNFPTIYAAQSFIVVFTRTLHWFLS